jgi:hypothetical protein
MRIINQSGPFVIISWEELSKFLEYAPIELLDKYLKKLGCEPDRYQDHEKISRIFIELEEQL